MYGRHTGILSLIEETRNRNSRQFVSQTEFLNTTNFITHISCLAHKFFTIVVINGGQDGDDDDDQ